MPAHWLAAPGADISRVLLFLHGGGFQMGSLRSDGELAAWRWLRTGQDLSARSIAVAGDSAGGGLAVALLVATRDAGQALPAAAVLMSPTVDLTSSGPR